MVAPVQDDGPRDRHLGVAIGVAIGVAVDLDLEVREVEVEIDDPGATAEHLAEYARQREGTEASKASGCRLLLDGHARGSLPDHAGVAAAAPVDLVLRLPPGRSDDPDAGLPGLFQKEGNEEGGKKGKEGRNKERKE